MTDYIDNVIVLLIFLGLLACETIRPSKIFQYPKKGGRLSHGALNIGIGVLGTAISYILFLPAWARAAELSAMNNWGLLHVVPMTLVGRICAALLLLDLWMYWWHRMNHRIDFLWKFHRAHHSDLWMDATSAQRFHPGEMVISSALRIPIILIAGVELWHVALYDAVMLAVVLFHHSNIAVPPDTDRLLRLVIPSPIMHKIHHSRLQSETDSNYSALFSFWDRIFGSFRMRSDWQDISFGRDGYDDYSSQTLSGFMTTPLRSQR